jgi:hypothetical protein
MPSLNTSRYSLSVQAGDYRACVETGRVITVEPSQGPAPETAHYLQLIQTLSSARANVSGAGVFLFTAANRGDGVSFIVKSLAAELARASGERVLHVPAAVLGEEPFMVSLPAGHSAVPAQGEVFAIRQATPRTQNCEARHFSGNINETRRHFGWVLIDCPSLGESDFALALAPQIDGVVFVVAADQTKRADIARAQRSIQRSSGSLLGFVLNKRTYPVPDFLYRRL